MTRRPAPKPIRYDAGDVLSKNGVRGKFVRAYKPGHIEVVFDADPSRPIVLRDQGFRIVERSEPARRRREAQQKEAQK